MRCYVVTLERQMVVCADSDLEAERKAIRYERDECGTSGPSIRSAALATERNVDREWLPCLPYGGDGKTTVSEYIGASHA